MEATLEIGPRLRELRKAADLTQQELAKLVDCNWETISRWERGERTPSAQHLLKLAVALQVTPDAFTQDGKKIPVLYYVDESEVAKADDQILRDTVPGLYRPDPVTEISVYPNARLSADRKRLYRGRATLKGGKAADDFFAKVGSKNDTHPEWGLYCKYVRENPMAEFWAPANGHYAGAADGSQGCFACTVRGADPTPLRDYLIRSEKGTETETDIWRPVTSLLQLTRSGWATEKYAPETREITWLEAYKTFLFGQRGEDWKCAEEEWEEVGPKAIQHLDLVSPTEALGLLASGKAARSKVRYRVVHGDFHQRNIILSKPRTDQADLRAYLIDFRRTGPFHALFDCAKLESSLTVFHYSGLIGGGESLRQVYDYLHARDLYLPCEWSLTARERKMVGVLEAIRAEAKLEALNWPHEYYLASLLVNFGMLAVRTAPRWAACVSAAWFATQLRDRLGG